MSSKKRTRLTQRKVQAKMRHWPDGKRKCFYVMYNLPAKSGKRDYDPIIDLLKELGGLRVGESAWLVEESDNPATKTVQTLFKALASVVKSSDPLTVCEARSSLSRNTPIEDD